MKLYGAGLLVALAGAAVANVSDHKGSHYEQKYREADQKHREALEQAGLAKNEAEWWYNVSVANKKAWDAWVEKENHAGAYNRHTAARQSLYDAYKDEKYHGPRNNTIDIYEQNKRALEKAMDDRTVQNTAALVPITSNISYWQTKYNDAGTHINTLNSEIRTLNEQISEKQKRIASLTQDQKMYNSKRAAYQRLKNEEDNDFLEFTRKNTQDLQNLENEHGANLQAHDDDFAELETTWNDLRDEQELGLKNRMDSEYAEWMEHKEYADKSNECLMCTQDVPTCNSDCEDGYCFVSDQTCYQCPVAVCTKRKELP